MDYAGLVMEKVTSTFNAIACGWIFVMMLLIAADVFFRFAFNSPIRGVPLIISMSIIAVVFLQLADTVRTGRLTQSDMLITHLIQTRPRLGHSLQGLFHLVGVFVMGAILWYSVPFLTKAWQLGTYDGTPGDFAVPEWPVKAVIVLGAALCTLQFFYNFLRDIGSVNAVKKTDG